MSITELTIRIITEYGPQGWWPVKGEYHQRDYSIPRNKHERFEIIIGVILTQNTSWKNVEQALKKIREHQLINPKKILMINPETLKKIIRPAGYYNQKAERLRIIAEEFLKKDEEWKKRDKEELREELLRIKGIGKESADSIILYAYKKPIMIIDAYTRRILKHYKIISDEKEEYDQIRKKIEYEIIANQKEIKEETGLKGWELFNELHATIVAHGKRHFSKKPYDDNLLLSSKKKKKE